jgi:peroxiredoxin Q/BCP
MALKVGSKAPDFILPSTAGKNFNLQKDKSGKPLIIYFYPKDFTPGCTAEACEFRDTFELFKDMNIEVIGISRDTILTHHEFKKANKLPFELLSDTNGKVAKLYDAVMSFINFTLRVTYLLDKQHNVAAVYQNLFGAKKHILEMIAQVKKAES